MENCTSEITFPQFVMEREIKSSDRSRVCLVRKKETGKRYIYRSFTGSGKVYHKLLGIDCPYLPRVYDVKEENGIAYVLEEYIQGDTLDFLLACGPLSVTHATQIIVHICHALKVLHGMGAVHRDIKPENIILRGSDAVLIDFDASRLCKAENTTDTRIMGTTGYAAPEQYGFSQTDARADIYALGILLNEMLTKQHPSKQLAEGKFRPIIEKCTRINADQRYASVSELTTAINTPPRKKKAAFRLVLALLLISALLLGSSSLFRKAPEEEIQASQQTHELPQTQTKTETKPKPALPRSNEPKDKMTQMPTEFVTIGQWEGSASGSATTFFYDLDEDGIDEQYLFGVDYLSSPPPYLLYDEINTHYPGEIHPRDLFPCVWQVNSDGSMEIAEEFTELLTDAQSSIWLVEGPGSPEPRPMRAEYTWPGAISVRFSPEEDSTWLYTVSAYLNGQELTAQATFRFIPYESFY